ncbi:hypothetical protein [Micromonospora sp. NBC_00898]
MDDVLAAYPYLEREDVVAVQAIWRRSLP